MAGRDTTTPRPRIGNACDNCKARKVRCDGGTPCGYCSRRRHPLVCQYTPQRRRRPRTPSTGGVPHNNIALETEVSPASAAQTQRLPAEDETEVPREGRIIKDAYGKMVFIGDCAPLSFYQSIRQLITTHVEPSAFAQQNSQPSVLQNSRLRQLPQSTEVPPAVSSGNIGKYVKLYHEGTAGIIDLFSESSIENALTAWVMSKMTTPSLSTVYYLVLAIGSQPEEDDIAHVYFEYAKGRALSSLGADINIETVQSFILITIFLLRACQTNGAFVFFGIAVRSAFSIGLHRAEANALFGDGVGKQRDRIWKSLRIVDLYLSASMGRPPATSDVDCTVSYRQPDENTSNAFDSLNAAVQILLISESVVTQVYSRRKINLAVTEGISAQLRDWSNRWLKPLQAIIQKSIVPTEEDVSAISGACQVLGTYYYTVMLVSRPFLMYEARQRLLTGFARADAKVKGSSSGRLRLADACIDAAAMLAELVGSLVDQRVVKRRMPILVSWLFASSLVLGLGLVGGFGRILEKYSLRNVSSLNYFSRGDAHAMQYSLIIQSLIKTALDFLDKRDLQERRMRTEKSRQLFGMVSQDYNAHTNSGESVETSQYRKTQSAELGQRLESPATDLDDTSMQDFYTILASATLLPGQGPTDSRPTGQAAETIDLSIFDGLFEGMSEEDCAGINLFPLLEDGPPLEVGQPL